MKTLVLNCGSSSLKFQLFDTDNDSVIAKGLVEKIGSSKSIFSYRPNNKTELRDTLELKNHDMALQLVIKMLTDTTRGVIAAIGEIDAIGHRVVHGGEAYSDAVLITADVVQKIADCAIFAPLHNPPNLMGINACSAIMPAVPQVAVFDTAFHQNMPRHAYLYALPYSFYEKHGIRRYGFHGTSHAYVSRKAAQLLGKDYHDFKVIVCHLGNGASMAAVRNGVSIDTSMGFTPLEGLMMGTRCGDIDPAIVPYIMQKEGLSSADIDNIMNKLSGLKGITKTSTDMREVQEEAHAGSEAHQLALEMFCYRIKKYIGSYIAVLNGADAVVFTAGIGENSFAIRQRVCDGLDTLGITLDPQLNAKGETVISTGRTRVMVVPTNEELAIAHETSRILLQRHTADSARREQELVTMELARISDPLRAKIAILWARSQTPGLATFHKDVLRELEVEVSTIALKELLRVMGLLTDARAVAAAPQGDRT